MSELVVVYHRQPFEERVINGERVLRSHRSPNGIVPTLRGFFQYFDQGTWVAWTEVEQSQAGTLVSNNRVEYAGEAYNVAQLGLTAEQVESFYKITSKAALWPILHSFTGYFDYDAADWKLFQAVNQYFADVTCEVAAPGAVVWVHDYNLWLVPGMIRRKRPDVRLAFYHHTPFPSSDVFSILPWRREITESLLSCDHVGFHSARYAENFASTARAFAGARTAGREPVDNRLQLHGRALQETFAVQKMSWQGREVDIDISPLGVDAKRIEEVAAQESTQSRAAEIRRHLGVSKVLLSVGRVDYTKGTLELLDAYERLLARRSELHGEIKLCLTSVAPSAGMRVYDDILADIQRRVGAINGHYSRLGWTPIALSTAPIPFEDLIAWYSAADICWITPLRDGLNLVCKEYVATKRGGDGMLVISEFAGAAVELDEAVMTHPYSARNMDDAIDAALDMPPAEARTRMSAMRDTVHKHDLLAWTHDMLDRFGVGHDGMDNARNVGSAGVAADDDSVSDAA